MWRRLGDVDPTQLEPARLAAHWAVQTSAALGGTLAPAQADDGHTSLVWHEASRRLVGASVPTSAGGRALRAALALDELRLGLLDADDRLACDLDLDGETIDGAIGWLAIKFQELGGESVTLRRPEFELPAHPVADGAPLEAQGLGPALGELQRWFANANQALIDFLGEDDASTPVRVWPHHFDIGAVITVAQRSDGEPTRTIGVGLSPGDESYAEPYVYANAWPRPRHLGGHAVLNYGEWNRDGWFGAVLRGSSLTSRPRAEQRSMVDTFFGDTVTMLRKIHES